MALFTTKSGVAFYLVFFSCKNSAPDPWDTRNCTLQILHPSQHQVGSLKEIPRMV